MKEKSKHANLIQQNGFISAFLHTMMMAKGTQQSLTPVVDWLDCLIGPDGLLCVVPRTFWWASQFQFSKLEVGKKKYLPTNHVILVLLWGHIHTKHGWRCF
jgi:hypothetical protein